jgi:hypothetical protein
MALERDNADLEAMRLEARLGCMESHQSADPWCDPGQVPLRYNPEADSLGLDAPSIDQASIVSVRKLLEQTRAGRAGVKLEEYNNKLHQHLVLERGQRPRGGAKYMAPRCRLTPDGAGGAPLSRPSSAPSGGRSRPAKTERWRETGHRRWPKEYEKTTQPSDPSDGDPMRRCGQEQPFWCQELWIRSLRRPGVDMQDLVYDEAGQRGVRELHEEWTYHRPGYERPVSARSITRTTNVPFSGSTSRAKAAIRQKREAQAWIERPVSTGKASLTHMGGKRYEFNHEPRYLEWQEYIKLINR